MQTRTNNVPTAITMYENIPRLYAVFDVTCPEYTEIF